MADSRQVINKASTSFEPQSLSPMFQKRPFAAEPEEDLDEQETKPIQTRLDAHAPPLNLMDMPLYSSGAPAYPVQAKSEEETEFEDEPEDFTLQRRAFASLVQRQADDPETEEEEKPLSTVQAKLTIGQPGDRYEQEADQVAAQVMKMPESSEEEESSLQRQPQINPLVQRQADDEAESDDKLAQMKPGIQAKNGKQAAPSKFESRLSQQKSSGRPLPKDTRSFMESRFGADFGGVRIHESPKEASEIGAQAFTHGQDIYFNSGKYNPGSSSGKELLAHELTHTIQQTGGQLKAKQSSFLDTSKKSNKDNIQTKALSSLAGHPTVQCREAVPQEESGAESTTEAGSAPAGSPPATTTQSSAPQSGEVASPEAGSNAANPASAAPVSAESGSTEGDVETASAPQQSAASAAGDAGGSAGSGGSTGASGTDGASAPKSPEADPGFQTVVAQSGAAATDQKQHDPAEAESQEAQDAAESPTSEVESQAQDQQVGDMAQQEPGEFDGEAFKAEILNQLKSVMPTNEEEADRFRDSNQVDTVRDSVASDVSEEQDNAAAPIEDKAEEEPDTSNIEPRQSTPMESPETGEAPIGIDGTQAAPKPKSEGEVSAPLQANNQELDQQMAEADITEEQLANSNEPTFVAALDSKNEAQTHSETAPAGYRKSEEGILTQAQSSAQATVDSQTQGMHSQREQLLAQVGGVQDTTKGQDEQKRTEIADHINGIYERVKTDVETSLNGLEGEVVSKFESAANTAKQVFEDYVAEKMDAYKKERYGEWFDPSGWGKRIGDAFTGLPPEVNQFFIDGRQKYIDEMDTPLTEIADLVASRLNEAKTKISQGRQEIQEYVQSLPQELQQVGQDAAQSVQSKFDELEQSVDAKKDELVSTIVQKYQENLQAVDARIEEMKEQNKGLVDKAKDAIGGTIQTIMELKSMLEGVLSKASDAIGNIIKDPIGFLNNLISGVTQGLQSFLGNIWEHLQGGLVGWLTGALGPMGITIPEDLFSLQGIFSLVTQVLGLTWGYIRGKAVNMFGEPTVGAMEQGVEMIQVVRDEGPEGMWEQVKEDFSDLKATVIDQIKNMVITQVITAGVKWIIGLLNPASAFVKACMAIYDIVMFFINQGSQVLELVNAVIDAIVSIAQGAVGGAAKLVENALVKALPVAIGFLASLLGISGLAKKVQGIIKNIRKRIDQAIDKLLKKAKNLFKKKNKDKNNKEAKDDKRTKEQQEADINEAVIDAEKIMAQEETTVEFIEEKLPVLKSKHALTSAKLINDGNDLYHINVKINPEGDTKRRKLNSNDDLSKAKGVMFNWLFTAAHLSTELGKKKADTEELINEWIAGQKLFALPSRGSRDPNPDILYSFDRSKTTQNYGGNRESYGYRNPQKDSAKGLAILSKGFNSLTPTPINATDKNYHKNKARYKSMRPGSTFNDFTYINAILGHNDNIESAADHWNKIGHRRTKEQNLAWNQNPNNYWGPEHKTESAASGSSTPLYVIPSPSFGSHPDWYNND